MSDESVPPFAIAKERLRAFIESQGFSPDLQWIFRENIVERWARIFVKVPLPPSEVLVEVLYDQGRARGLGVHLEVFCVLEDRPCCYIWLPQDEQDADYRMLSGLKLSVPADRQRAIVKSVKGRFHWRWLKWRDRLYSGPRWANQIPLRSAVQ